ncbi:DgyrCDS12766 [Dimorphilus gyrociliatus]|uniref:DgyrCDS12766 n=1 Tax=Dimorphilus gyrociliatus TaxID=2664684 RepID=A0A7I8W8N8_9ANNE|nr:DgyrCDS12766 [Dimorphilus gyrociliatus]
MQVGKSADSDFGQRFRRLSSEIGYSSERTDIANAGIIPEALLNDIGSSVDGLDSDNRKDIRKKYQVIDDEDFGQTDLNVEY